jgi:hypothetical protein
MCLAWTGLARAGGTAPADALRTLQVLGEAYGLGPQALGEWMHLLAHNTLPPPDWATAARVQRPCCLIC